ncbi:hypothetical protein JOQ06_002108, partial [Pogonophryne albipinna]
LLHWAASCLSDYPASSRCQICHLQMSGGACGAEEWREERGCEKHTDPLLACSGLHTGPLFCAEHPLNTRTSVALEPCHCRVNKWPHSQLTQSEETSFSVLVSAIICVLLFVEPPLTVGKGSELQRSATATLRVPAFVHACQ